MRTGRAAPDAGLTPMLKGSWPDLVANFVANKRDEWQRYVTSVGEPGDEISDWELAEYLPFH